MKKVIAYLLCYLIIFQPVVFAANLYVDPFVGSHSDETWSGTNGESYTSTAAGFPGDGTGYGTVRAALLAMASGDDIYARGGAYGNAQLGSGTYNTLYLSDGEPGISDNYSSIQSFPGEWAILDGENNTYNGGRSLGIVAASNDGFDVASLYWRIERLEFKNGGSSDSRAAAAGLSVSFGPVIIRYCYIHDNKATGGGDNPAGLCAYILQDSVIEYNLFHDNGADITTSHNACHIEFFSEYGTQRQIVAKDGFAAYANAYNVQRNEVRYNYFNTGTVGITTKGNQLFTSRSQDAGDPGWSDTYQDRGNKYHHNIFSGMAIAGILSKDDFNQIHNNIADDCTSGIRLGTEGRMYKQVVYNNTVIGNALDEDSFHAAIGSVSAAENPDYDITSPENSLHAYFYNNIIDSGADFSSLCEFSIGRELAAQYIASMDYSTVDIKALYSYRGDDAEIISIYEPSHRADRYTIAQWNAIYSTDTVYANAYDAENLLFQGSTGADKYRVRSAHTIATGVTAGAGGRGGNHPYLSGVTIPAYIGAANPADDAWVAQVLAMDSTVFTAKSSQGDAAYNESWIEGATHRSMGAKPGLLP